MPSWVPASSTVSVRGPMSRRLASSRVEPDSVLTRAATVRSAMKDEQHSFRITMWPGVPLPYPAVRRWTYRWDSTESGPRAGRPDHLGQLCGQRADVPRPVELDLADRTRSSTSRTATRSSACTTRTAMGGPPRIRAVPRAVGVRGATLRVDGARKEAQRALDEHRERLRLMARRPDSASRRSGRSIVALKQKPLFVGGRRGVETLEEFVLGAQTIRDALRVWALAPGRSARRRVVRSHRSARRCSESWIHPVGPFTLEVRAFPRIGSLRGALSAFHPGSA